MKLTKKFIKENAGMTLKEAFPEVFETVLEVGKWYKSTNSKALACVEELFKDDFKGYGFDKDSIWWSSSEEWTSSFDLWIPSTPQEIQDALKKEAVRRGYGIGVSCKFGTAKTIREIKSDKFNYNKKFNIFTIGSDAILQNGQWATIIQTITKQEAE